jgi:DNA-binding HxlR family transcriptional regulator
VSPDAEHPASLDAGCCPLYHEAIELIGRRWTGAIVAVLLERGTMRFSEISAAVPQLSDRLLSERMKQLEGRGLVVREVDEGPPVRVSYRLTNMGRALAPAVDELHVWARNWLVAPGPPVESEHP